MRDLYRDLFRLVAVVICFIPPTAIATFLGVRWRKHNAASVVRSRERSSVWSWSILVLALFATGYAAFYVQFRLAFFTIAASHVMDIPPPYERWLDWFFWASYAVPATWVILAGCSVFEFMCRHRLRRIGFSIAAPFVIAGLHFALWQIYFALMP